MRAKPDIAGLNNFMLAGKINRRFNLDADQFLAAVN
jgi:hypothetical protein